MTEEEDEILRRAFATLREEEEGALPDFASLRTRAIAAQEDAETDRRSLTPTRSIALVAFAAAIAGWFLATSPPRPEPLVPEAAPFSPGQWAMPSDALLDLSRLPGSGVMGSLDWSPPPPRRDGAASGHVRRFDLSAAPPTPRVPSLERSFA